MTFGGIYREVSLRIVPETYIDNIFARAERCADRQSVTRCGLLPCGRVPSGAGARSRAARWRASHRHTVGSRLRRMRCRRTRQDQPAVHAGSASTPATRPLAIRRATRSRSPSSGIQLWDLEHPHLYTVHVRLLRGRRRGRRGLAPHRLPRSHVYRSRLLAERKDRQAARPRSASDFPFVGQAMPARVQRQDAKILRKNLHCNIVRTSHYPQSRHFLDACDEIGLLVLEEIPGWQHIGDAGMEGHRRRQRRPHDPPRLEPSRPSFSGECASTNRATITTSTRAPTRWRTRSIRRGRPAASATSRSRSFSKTSSPMNDFGFPLRPPNHPLYLNTEFVGPHLSHQDHRRRRAPARAHAAPCAHSRSACLGSAICRRHRLVRVRLQHPRQLRLRRPHLLSRRHGHLPRAQARRRLLQVAVRSRAKRSCSSRPFTGRAAMSPSASPRRWSAPTAII